MFWKFLLLWFKFLGLILVVNWIMMKTSKEILYENSSLVNKSTKDKRKFSLRVQSLFQIINLIPYYLLLKMAVKDFEVEQLSRLHLALLLIPFMAASSFLRKAGKTLDRGSAALEEISTTDEKALRRFYSDVIIGTSVRNGLAIAFFIHIVLLIAPSLQTYVL